MASESALKVALYIVNVVYAVLGLGLTAASIWFYVQVYEFTSLRNSNHYLLDYRVYWLQVTPWLFIILGVAILAIACCGWLGASRDSSGVMKMHSIFLIIIVIAHCIIAALVFVFVNGEATDLFVKDTVYDGYYNSENDPVAFRAFGNIERKLRCCGANDARDYKAWRNELPLTCCNESYYANYDLNNQYYTSQSYQSGQKYGVGYGAVGFGASGYGSDYYNNYNRGYKICDFTDKEANERFGCIKVASVYAKIIGLSIAGCSLVVALIELVGLVIAWRLYKILKGEEHYISRNGIHHHHQPTEKSETDC